MGKMKELAIEQLNKGEVKILVIYLGSYIHTDSAFYILDPDTGECLASHYCSGSRFAKGDLHDHRQNRLNEWKIKYKKTTMAKFIDETSYDWEEIYSKNQKLKENVENSH